VEHRIIEDIAKKRELRRARAGKSIKDKALQVIEVITCNDDFALSKSPYAKLLVKIYTYSHVANGTCGNEHKDWVEGLNEVYTSMLERGEV
jgi:hypothetical protein